MNGPRQPTTIGALIAPLFGGQPDGTYKVSDDLGGAGELMPLVQWVAEIGRVGIDEVLDLDWIELLEELYVEAVRNEAGRLRFYARQHGLTHLEQKLGAYMAERAAAALLSAGEGDPHV